MVKTKALLTIILLLYSPKHHWLEFAAYDISSCLFIGIGFPRIAVMALVACELH